VLLPTRNSRERLPAHIHTLRALLPSVHEIVVVDSESTDGTNELLRAEFKDAPVRFLTHPPGLYESWNFGVNACAAEYVYISTVGDAITWEGLQRLADAAARLKRDVVISPPRLLDARGAEVKKDWPIFELIETLNIRSDLALDSESTLLFAIAFLRQAILGSSASNIYRAEVLRARPFPTDFGHGGDVGWGLRHAAEIRLGIMPDVVSTFVFHEGEHRVVENAGAIRVAAARGALAGARARISGDSAALCDQLCTAWEHLFRLNQCRRNTTAWILRPQGWRDRATQRQAAARVKSLQRDALGRIRARLAQRELPA